MKKILITLSIVIFVIGAVYFFMLLKNRKIAEETNPGEQISIDSSNGPIAVLDYEKNAKKIDENDSIISENGDYQILAFNYGGKKSFMIFIKNSSLEATRRKAESEFMQKLGITQQEACGLEVSVAVSNDVSSNLTDNYGLSFCSNGKIIE